MTSPLLDLFNCLDDEIEGIKHYAEMACSVKEAHPEHADILHKLSVQEDEHYMYLTNMIKEIIETEELDDMEKELCQYILESKAKRRDKAVSCQRKYKG